MATMMDYLDWRGDVRMEWAAFNEVDNLILAQIAYVALDGIVPAPEAGGISLREAAQAYFSAHTEEEVRAMVSFTKDAAFLLRRAGETDRFCEVRMLRYLNEVNPENAEQFSALCYALPDGTVYVAYRGTDDTIVGWKEDFNMSFVSPVPSQLEAVRYLEQTAQALRAPLRLGGHSKGGNLAVYAAVHCRKEVRERIRTIYNNDGPGFMKKTVETEEYQSLCSRMETIVPQSSVVGMLLEHEDDYTVVGSTQKGLMQHDAMSWCVRGTQFVRVEEINAGARLLDDALHAWIASMDSKQRAAFVETLFDALDATQAKTLGELTENAWQSVSGAAKCMWQMSKEDKANFTKTLQQLFEASGRQLYRRLTPERPEAGGTAEKQKTGADPALRGRKAAP